MLKSNLNSKVNDFLLNIIYNTEKIRQSVEVRLINNNRCIEKQVKKST